MSKIIEIESALNQISGDIFQEFCNHFLYYKLNPNSIVPYGSVVSKEKSRKGIPDSYSTLEDGQLVFSAFTTKENLENHQLYFRCPTEYNLHFDPRLNFSLNFRRLYSFLSVF